METRPMQQHVFRDLGELEDVKNRLARATRHPMHVDLGTTYEDDVDSPDPIDPHALDDYHVIWNNRDDCMAYRGSKRYNLIQHREVIDSIQTAVDNTVGSIDKGVIRDYGSSVDGVLVFGDQDEASVDVMDLVGDGGYIPPEGAEWTEDVLGLGMRFYNGWDGRTKIGGSTMGYRYICQNWMVWSEHTIASESDMHLKGRDDAVGVDPEFFESIINRVFDKRKFVEEVVVESTGERFPLDWTPDVLEAAGFGAGYARAIAGFVRDQHEADDGKTTLWNVYNAATAYIDHEKAEDVGESVYQRHHETAWDVLSVDVEEPEDVRSLRAFASTS